MRCSTSPRRSRASTPSTPTGSWSRRSTRGRRLGRRRGSRGSASSAVRPRRSRWGVEANENPPRLQHPRPLRTPNRRGRVPPRLARAARRRGRLRRPRAAVARAPAWRPCRPRGDVHALRSRRGRGRLSDLDDLLGDPGASQAARARRRVGAEVHLARYDGSSASRRRTRRAPLRDGDDREAGGSDVRANTTVAKPVNGGGAGAEY